MKTEMHCHSIYYHHDKSDFITKERKEHKKKTKFHIYYMMIRVSVFVALFIAITLFVKSNWSSTIFRISSTIVDLSLWDGMMEEYYYNSNYYHPSSSSTTIKPNSENFQEFKPLTASEKNRRRFVFLEYTNVPTIQGFIFRLMLSSLTNDQQKHKSNNNENDGEPVRILFSSDDDENKKPVQFPLRISYKIYDRSRTYQLAPLSEYYSASSASSSSPKDKMKEQKIFKKYQSLDEKNPLFLTFHSERQLQEAVFNDESQLVLKNVLRMMISSSSPTSKDSSRVGDDQVFTLNMKRLSVRLSNTAAPFGKRGMPLWNILPNEESLVVEMKVVE